MAYVCIYLSRWYSPRAHQTFAIRRYRGKIYYPWLIFCLLKRSQYANYYTETLYKNICEYVQSDDSPLSSDNIDLNLNYKFIVRFRLNHKCGLHVFMTWVAGSDSYRLQTVPDRLSIHVDASRFYSIEIGDAPHSQFARDYRSEV